MLSLLPKACADGKKPGPRAGSQQAQAPQPAPFGAFHAALVDTLILSLALLLCFLLQACLPADPLLGNP